MDTKVEMLDGNVVTLSGGNPDKTTLDGWSQKGDFEYKTIVMDGALWTYRREPGSKDAVLVSCEKQ